MSEVLLFTVLTLCIVGVLAAVVLYFVAQKFKVYEDPRIDAVESMLPGANCGGCGYPGCRGLADALVGSDDLSSLYCTAGGAETMKRIAEYLGKVAPEKEPAVAVVRCNGSCEKRPRTNIYDGAASCAIEAALYGGETGCSYGCLGGGDCVSVCAFGALSIDPRSGLPRCERSALHCLRRVRQGLSQRNYRASQERSERPQGLRRVRKQGQRRHSAESLRLCLHRMRQMSENMFFRCDYITEQFSIYRCGQMSLMP